MQKKIVYTDLDGTLTLKDTYTKLLFKQITFGKFLKNFFSLTKCIIFYYLKIYSQDKVKEITFKILFSNKKLHDLKKDIESVINETHWNQKLLDKIQTYQDNGYKVIIVTASPDFYVQNICDLLKLDGFLASKTIVCDDTLTGHFDGKICNFEEKVIRIKNSSYFNDDLYKISFGNSKGDIAMLNFCEESYLIHKSNMKRFK